MLSSLVEFIMKACYHPARQIMKNNLELLKAFIERWKTVPEINTK